MKTSASIVIPRAQYQKAVTKNNPTIEPARRQGIIVPTAAITNALNFFTIDFPSFLWRSLFDWNSAIF
jgi:hypothetical protein